MLRDFLLLSHGTAHLGLLTYHLQGIKVKTGVDLRHDMDSGGDSHHDECAVEPYARYDTETRRSQRSQSKSLFIHLSCHLSYKSKGNSHLC